MDSKPEPLPQVPGSKNEPGHLWKWYRKLEIFLEMIKFEHSIFALPFAYLGLFLAEEGWPRPSVFVMVTVAMVSFRTMGMALNRLIDAEIDARNPRTANRAIPAGLLRTPFVWGVTAVSFAVFEAACWKLGPLCLKLSVVPVVLTILYPFAKRFTFFSHMVLGMILAIAPYGAWMASRGAFSWIPGFISLGVLCWVTGFDMIYALQDLEFDRSSGLYSFPSRFGEQAVFHVTRVLHVLTLVFWIAAGKLAGLGLFYLAGMAVTAVFLFREHWLIRSHGMKKIQEAFFTMNAVVSVTVFAVTAAEYSFRSF